MAGFFDHQHLLKKWIDVQPSELVKKYEGKKCRLEGQSSYF